jgi:3D (Asp-Asp-Asp) domain-containing protein
MKKLLYIIIGSLVLLLISAFMLDFHRQREFNKYTLDWTKAPFEVIVEPMILDISLGGTGVSTNIYPENITELSFNDDVIIEDRVLTAYCPCVKCCGKWADGITASGEPATEGRTAALNNVPFGTVLEIPGIGTRIVEDRTSTRFSGVIDIYFNSHQEALEFGRRNKLVKIKLP